MPSEKKPRRVPRFEIAFQVSARNELLGLYDYIAEHSGIDAASSYVARIEEACLDLQMFPERGNRRDDIKPNLRILGFERRVAIAFKVDRKRRKVLIVRIFYGGRAYEHILLGSEGQ